MKRLLGTALVASVLALYGCNGIPGLVSPAGTTARQTGQWQKTTIVLQKYKTVAFKEKATGRTLSPDAAQAKNPDEVTLEAGDFEELTYAGGKLRYAAFGHEATAQPYVVERSVGESEFETLDKGLYDEKYFTFPMKNWDVQTRLPLYFLRYNQNGLGYEASFTPSLNRMPKTGKLLESYLAQFAGDEKLSEGVTQIAYVLGVTGGTLKVSVLSQSRDRDGETTDVPVKLKGVQYDLGSGYQSATIEKDGESFSLAQPAKSGKGDFQLIGLKVTPESGDAWDSLIPIRLK